MKKRKPLAAGTVVIVIEKFVDQIQLQLVQIDGGRLLGNLISGQTACHLQQQQNQMDAQNRNLSFTGDIPVDNRTDGAEEPRSRICHAHGSV